MTESLLGGVFKHPAGTRLRVLLADDHSLFLDGLASILEQEGFAVVGRAQSGQEAIQLYLQTLPDVGLFDLRMPDMDGADCIRSILERVSHARLIVLSTYGAEEDVQRALEAGARSYLMKDVTRERLTQVLLEAASALPGQTQAEAVARPAHGLSHRELEVLKLLVAGHANKVIADVLHITEGTVKVHCYRIYRKLGVSSRTEALRLALQQGLGQLTL